MSALVAVAAGAVAAPPRPRRSLIAGANALFRMKESTRARRILDDPWAARLADDHWLLSAIRYGRFVLPPLWRAIDELQTAHCARHRAIDELTLAALADGYRQVVVIGAGYDMRASRFAERLDGVRWIEVDLPDTAARKQELLDGAGARPVERAAVDLSQRSLAAALRATSFDPDAPALFVLEGLIHYLPAERLDALLAEIAHGRARRRVVLSFIRTGEYEAVGGALRSLFRLLREIPRLHFAPEELAALLARHRLGRFRSWTFAEQVAAFAPEAAGRRVRSTQDVALASRE